ncbi:hypothetical protein, partial [Klebsiella pneumoniae]|uniref:hypothetical protein n=1 Tax=Klebsiella pneumoniae TaxID=573 RepID=UPI001C6FB7FD
YKPSVLAREIISSSEAVTMMNTAKTYLITLHPDHTNCLYALVRIRYQDLCPGTPVHVRQRVYSTAQYILYHIADFHRHKVIQPG